MELKNVLMIEDNEETQNTVVEEFTAQGVTLLRASGAEDLEKYLTSPPKFQMVILDWLLDGETSDLARVCLKRIRQSYFVPVLIWTEQVERFDDEADTVKKDFPPACLQAKSKKEVQYEDLLAFLNEWYKTTPAKLSSQFRQSIVASVEQALYTLAEHSADDLAKGLKALISLGDSNEVDVEHAVDVLMRLVSRAISVDENFTSEIQRIVAELKHSPNISPKIESRIKELHMYYEPKDLVVRTGDIVDITIEVGEQSESFKGVVITPACDLARPRTAFLRMALINETPKASKAGDKWEMSFLDKQGKKFEVCFHEILTVKNQTLAVDMPLDQKPIMLYAHSYRTLNGAKAILKRQKRLDEPYRADLLHCFASHAGRIGFPEFTAE